MSENKPKELRILYITPFPPTRNGIADYAYTFYTRAIEEGLNIQVFTDPEEKWLKFSLKQIIKIFYRLLKEIKSFKPQIIHIETGGSLPREFLLALLLSLFKGLILKKETKLVLTIHDPPTLIDLGYLGKFFLGLKRITKLKRILLSPFFWLPRKLYTYLLVYPFWRFSHLVIFLRTDLFFVLSPTGLMAIEKTFKMGHKGRYLPHGILHEAGEPSPELKALLTKPEDRVLIATFGFIGPGKGYEDFLQALKMLFTKSPQLSTKIAIWLCGGTAEGKDEGYPRYLEEVLLGFRENFGLPIEMKGFIPPEATSFLFSQIDILVILGKRAKIYPTSGSLIRGMTHGVAILAPRVRAYEDELVSGVTGYLYQSPKHLASLLEILVNHTQLRAELGWRAKAHIQRYHCWKTILDRYKDLLQNLYF